MEIEEIESIVTTVMIAGLCSFMFFIMWDLARKSNAGKWGTFVILGGLGLGLFAFLIKGFVVELMAGGFGG
ncbi:DUF2788 domain-containing protein [Maribrevibacterium harenarium]|jgi:hypothetical protein|uniref:DUF2788 domain-containing protein n=1 Tax=Maribrevibacterium harenarium TaxID=2589817 RepID=A0A501WCD6_9GAMM|nr:DUF2788 domain-containing protein [Maribrevibacterium harenarium]TPE47593.1 DUF2788 domain-containing protein [Maribrevibacterium harenarium]